MRRTLKTSDKTHNCQIWHVALTGSPVAGDVFLDARRIDGGHGDRVLGVGLQLLQDDAGLLPSDLRLFTGNEPASVKVTHKMKYAQQKYKLEMYIIK